MVLSSTILVPELQYYFYSFIQNSKLNKYQINFPVDCYDGITPSSFIQLLFDDNWPNEYKSYKYCFREQPNEYSWPTDIKNRLNIYSNSAKYYILDDSNDIDSTSSNIFNLKSDDIIMLDKLLLYRLDSTSDISDIDSTSLTTNLSMMIYRYLDLKINNNYQEYNNTEIISDDNNILELFYEAYLIDAYFDFISDKGT